VVSDLAIGVAWDMAVHKQTPSEALFGNLISFGIGFGIGRGISGAGRLAGRNADNVNVRGGQRIDAGDIRRLESTSNTRIRESGRIRTERPNGIDPGASLRHPRTWYADNGGGSGNQRPKNAQQAIKAIQAGDIEITVHNRHDAQEILLNHYIGTSPDSPGYINTTGLSPTEAKKLHGRKHGTYHWDVNLANDGSIQGHGANNPHGHKPHLQIHTYDGDIIRIFFDE